MEILVTDPRDPGVSRLLEDHLADMYATSPAESVHALDPEALRDPRITFFAAFDDGVVLATGAIKALSDTEAELKSMRTTESARGRGVGQRMLAHLISEARVRGYRVVRLETGTQDYFAPARRLYARSGFVEGPPFAAYVLDPNSVFLHLELVPTTASSEPAGSA